MDKEPKGRLVTDPAEFRAVVDGMRGAGKVGFDTEFVGERTYYPRLCLLQLGTEKEVVAVDPLALDDLSPLDELLFDPEVLKIVHAGWQDLKIFFQRTGRVPAPVFDTQIAASVLGLPAQAAYASVVREFLGVDVKKGHSYSDWGARPLSASQLAYALDDVRYLPELHDRMTARLRGEGRLSWIEPDLAALASPATYESDPEEEYRRVKGWAGLDRRRLAVLRGLIAWREREARRRDVPRRRVLSDESALAIARSRAADEEGLRRVRGLEWKIGGDTSSAVLDAVRDALALPEGRLPGPASSRSRGNGERASVVALLGALLRCRARVHRVAPEVLANAEDLERLAAGERDGIPALSGWRLDLVGRELLALLEGKLSLFVHDGEATVEERRG
ncbi:MAG: Rnd [Deltaproteobacteria bacterium]|nr:Rnd [Deltaproteobacteria bacterium]